MILMEKYIAIEFPALHSEDFFLNNIYFHIYIKSLGMVVL